MSLLIHAKQELEAAGLFDKNSDYNGMIAESVMQLMQVFSMQGHSGMCAAIVSELFGKLSKYLPITPIKCDDSEWVDVGEIYQNKRLTACFKDKKTGGIYYVDSIVFKNQEGCTFTSSRYRPTITKLPFVPKTFVIDVIEDEKGWELADESQLKEVVEYYQV